MREWEHIITRCRHTKTTGNVSLRGIINIICCKYEGISTNLVDVMTIIRKCDTTPTPPLYSRYVKGFQKISTLTINKGCVSGEK